MLNQFRKYIINNMNKHITCGYSHYVCLIAIEISFIEKNSVTVSSTGGKISK